MKKFVKELNEGEIHFRDNLQFELKSDFAPVQGINNYVHTQEFYIFIPHALDINFENYSKSNFYKDQTNLIRYKTPEFTISELIDESNISSPLNILPDLTSHKELENELKLLGNIVRSALRQETRSYIQTIGNTTSQKKLKKLSSEILQRVKEIEILRSRYFIIQDEFFNAETQRCPKYIFEYVDEFLSNSIDYYLTGILGHLRAKDKTLFKSVDTKICKLLIDELKHREEKLHVSIVPEDESSAPEFLLYRKGVLNKFVLDALLLKINRTNITQKWSNFIGGATAGIAMFIYFSLFIWQGQLFVFNSFSFIVITTLLYILKDRMKEGLRNLFYRKAYKWFPDYTTEVWSPNEKEKIGRIKESEMIISRDKLPHEISEMRNSKFHTELVKFERHESIIVYKKSICLFKPYSDLDLKKTYEVNNIFRFNIQEFLRKASNPTQDFLVLDPVSKVLKKKRLPKVYHLNIILKNTFPLKTKNWVSEIKRYRLVIDKNGIKRVEQLP